MSRTRKTIELCHVSGKYGEKICMVYTRNLVISLFVYFVIKKRGKLDFN